MSAAGLFIWIFPMTYLYERGGRAIWACMLAHLGADSNLLMNLYLKDGMSMNWWAYHGGTVRTFALPLMFLLVFVLLLPRNIRRR